jgi:hypothetical protein
VVCGALVVFYQGTQESFPLVGNYASLEYGGNGLISPLLVHLSPSGSNNPRGSSEFGRRVFFEKLSHLSP